MTLQLNENDFLASCFNSSKLKWSRYSSKPWMNVCYDLCYGFVMIWLRLCVKYSSVVDATSRVSVCVRLHSDSRTAACYSSIMSDAVLIKLEANTKRGWHICKTNAKLRPTIQRNIRWIGYNRKICSFCKLQHFPSKMKTVFPVQPIHTSKIHCVAMDYNR